MSAPAAPTPSRVLRQLGPLALLRACVVVYVLFDLAVTLPTVPSPVWLNVALVASGEAAVLLALKWPLAGAVLSVVPLASRFAVGEQGYAFVPLIVCTIAVVASAHRRVVAFVIAGYCGLVATIAAHGSTSAALYYLGVLAASAAVGAVARVLLNRSRAAAAHISHLGRSIEEIRAEERAALAAELAGLLVDSLDSSGRALARAADLSDPGEVHSALTAVTTSSRLALIRLRGLVATLRLDGTREPGSPVANPDLIRVVEEAEDVLVGQGWWAEITLPDDLPPTDAAPAHALDACLRAASELVQQVGDPGEACRIALTAPPGRVGLQVTFHAAVPTVDDSSLAAQRAAVADLGGTFDTSREGTRWRLSVEVPRISPAAAAPVRSVPLAGLTRLDPAAVLTTLALVAVAATAWQAGGALASAAAGDPWAPEALWALTFAAVALSVQAPRAGAVLLLAGLVAGLWVPFPTAASGQAPELQIVALTVILTLRHPRRLLLIALGWFGYLLVWSRGHPDSIQLIALMLFPVVGMMITLGAKYFVGTRQAQLEELGRLARERASARAGERRQLAGELHDIVAHQLSLMSMQDLAADDSDLVALRTNVAGLARLNDAAQADLSTLLALMGSEPGTHAAIPDVEAGWSAPSAVAQAVSTTLAGAGHPVDLDLHPDVDDCAATTQRTLARVLREGTTNVLRYAPAGTSCQIRMCTATDEVTVEITNPLPSRPAVHPDSTGNGLRGLTERAALTGGRLSAGREGGHWRLAATLPRWDLPGASAV